MPMRTVPPVSWRQRLHVLLYAHPFEMALGGVLIVNAIRGVLGSFSRSVDALPRAPLVAYLAVTFLGGVLTLAGLWVGERRNGRALESFGLWLVAASYFGFAVLVVAVFGAQGGTTALVCTVVAAACILRSRAIRKVQTIILETLRERAEP